MKLTSIFILPLLITLSYAGILKEKPKEDLQEQDLKNQEVKQFQVLSGVLGDAINSAGAFRYNKYLTPVTRSYIPKHQLNNYVIGRAESSLPLGTINPRPEVMMNPETVTGQIPFGQYGFYPDFIQPPRLGQTVMASYPNFDYIVSFLPGWENFIFSPNPFFLRPEGDTWTGIENERIPVVWKSVGDYPFGDDGQQPYREIMAQIERWSDMGMPVHILENLISKIKHKKEKLAEKIGKPNIKPVEIKNKEKTV